MFDFVQKWLFRRNAGARKEDAESKARLDQLRRDELSLNARRQLAPDEPVTGPHIGHGSAQPVTDIAQIAAGFSGKARAKQGVEPDYGEVPGSGATQGPPAADVQAGSEGGAFGGSGGSDSFGSGGADTGASSGDSGDST